MKNNLIFEIQALRAVAMAIVVLFHFWPRWFPGGFVGVDVFFVISGFLIIGQIYREVCRSGTIDVLGFWGRRFRRLMPSATVVLAFSFVAAICFLPPVAIRGNLQEIVASALYAENWLLLAKAVDYLGAHDIPSMVQHYWSLSVEEQFYLFFPVLALVCVRWFKLSGAFFFLIASVSLASFAYCVFVLRPEQAFFSTFARVWEFCVGGVLALLPTLTLGHSFRKLLIFLGLSCIAYSVFSFGPATAFPGWLTLIPVVGAAVIIVARSECVERTERAGGAVSVLGARILQWLGDRSYSLYLWHWPLFVILHWRIGGDGVLAQLALVPILLFAAQVNYRYIEEPVRQGVVLQQPRVLFGVAVALISGLLILVGGVYYSFNDMLAKSNRILAASIDFVPCAGWRALGQGGAHCPNPYRAVDAIEVAASAQDVGPPNGCQVHGAISEVKWCQFGAHDDYVRTIAIVGNSHALRLVPALVEYGNGRGWRILLAAKTNCTGLVVERVEGLETDPYCLEWSAAVINGLLEKKVDAVLFASHVDSGLYITGFSDERSYGIAREPVKRTWGRLKDADIKIVVTDDVPGLRPEGGPSCLARSSDVVAPCAVTRRDFNISNLQWNLARLDQSVTSISLQDSVCDVRLCYAVIGGVPVYSDSHHITGSFARTLAPVLGPSLSR